MVKESAITSKQTMWVCCNTFATQALMHLCHTMRVFIKFGLVDPCCCLYCQNQCTMFFDSNYPISLSSHQPNIIRPSVFCRLSGDRVAGAAT